MATVYGDDNVTTLYKRDALGRIVFWRIETDGSHERVSYGLFERLSDVGQVIVSASTKTSYKSQIKRKIDRGYKTAEKYGVTTDKNQTANQLHDLLDNVIPKFATDANNVDKPMKCQKWKTGIFDYSNGAFADPKINGVRCTIKYEAVDNGLFGTTYEVVILLPIIEILLLMVSFILKVKRILLLVVLHVILRILFINIFNL